MSWFRGTRARLRLLLARGGAEARMDEEIRFHVDMETERLVRDEGLDPGEARRRALVAFGGVEKTREELREGRGLAWLTGMSLDLGGAPLHPQWPDGYRVSSAHVATDYFDVLGVPILAGRGFHSGDLEADTPPIIVNESFVERVLGGRNPIGRHVRYIRFEARGPIDREAQPWYEIVGVVRDLGHSYGTFDPKIAGFYHPAPPGAALPAWMAVHVPGDAAGFAPRLSAIAADTDPALRLYETMSFDRITAGELRFYEVWSWFLLLVCGIALFLSMAGIYAVTAFTVSQRTREIGIRVAMGADRRRVITAIFKRPLRQVGLGILIGGGLLSLIVAAGLGTSLAVLAGLVIYIGIITGLCLLATLVPTRRALAVEPSEALRWE